MIIYHARGRLEYGDGWRLVLLVEQDLSDYYRSLVPKWHAVNRPRWPAHITVVRQDKENPPHVRHWGRYQSDFVDFAYSPIVQWDETYFWLNVWCQQLEDIRIELGLQAHSFWTVPPNLARNFHCTVANCK